MDQLSRGLLSVSAAIQEQQEEMMAEFRREMVKVDRQRKFDRKLERVGFVVWLAASLSFLVLLVFHDHHV